MRSRLAGILWLMAAAVLALAAPPMKWEKLVVVKTAAEQGNTEAQFLLGLQYRAGDGVDRDPREAEKWLRKAAESGHAEAQLTLGELYADAANGLGDAAEAEKWLKAAAAQGNVAAQARLGAMRSRGGNRHPGAAATPPDPTEVANTLPAGEASVAPASPAVAVAPPATSANPARKMDEDPDETVRWSLILSGLRGPEAFLVRGYLLENGLAMNRDLSAAAASYRKAAELGHALGQYHFGVMLAEGRGVPRDVVQACAWLSLAERGGAAGAAAELTRLRATLTPEQGEAAIQQARDFAATTKK